MKTYKVVKSDKRELYKIEASEKYFFGLFTTKHFLRYLETTYCDGIYHDYEFDTKEDADKFLIDYIKTRDDFNEQILIKETEEYIECK